MTEDLDELIIVLRAATSRAVQLSRTVEFQRAMAAPGFREAWMDAAVELSRALVHVEQARHAIPPSQFGPR